MNKRRTIFISILYIALLLIINYGVILMSTSIFNINNNLEVGTNEYITELSKFLTKNQIWIVLVSFVFWIPYFYKLLKNKDILINKKGITKIYIYLLVLFIFNLLWNILLIFSGLLKSTNTTLGVSYLLSTTLIGPILEEFVFRGIIYNKLKKAFTYRQSIILVSFLFCLYHFNIIQSIYAFVFSILLTKIYEKYNNLLLPIIIHCLTNLTSSVLITIILGIL